MDGPFNESTNESISLPSEGIRHDLQTPIENGPYKNETLEKFIVLCRSRLFDTPSRRKKRYSGLRKSVARYNQSRHWNQTTFDTLIRKFSGLLEHEIEHKQADEIYGELLKELTSLSGRNLPGKCRKKKKRARNESTLAKLEKSLAVVQRRINRLKDESSADAWEARDGKCPKIYNMQKKAYRLTKKINDLNKLASNNSATNLNTTKGGNETNDGDMDELNCLLKSVRLKESVKVKPKTNAYKLSGGRFGSVKFASSKTNYPSYEMVEIKKYDQQNQCYVTNPDKCSSSPMPFKFTVRRKAVNVPNLSSSPSSSSPSDKCSDLRLNNIKSPAKHQSLDKYKAMKRVRLRKQSTFDLICDRFRHVTLNS